MVSRPFTLSAVGILAAACGSRTSASFLDIESGFGGAAAIDPGASGSTGNGTVGSGGTGIVGTGGTGIVGTGVGGALDSSPARDAGADAASGPSQSASPSEFGDRLAMWLDGSFGVIRTDDGITSIWVDRTANGNDAYATTQRPRRGLILGSHSLAALFFDGNAFMSIADGPTLQWGTDDYTIEVVAWYSNEPGPTVTGRACLYEKTSPLTPFEGVSLTGNGTQTGPIAALSSSVEGIADPRVYVTGRRQGVNDGEFHLFGTRRTGIHTLEVRLDGVSNGINSNIISADVSAVGQPVYIGGVLFASDRTTDVLSGAIAEIVAIHGVITDAELARLEAYLKGKYRL